MAVWCGWRCPTIVLTLVGLLCVEFTLMPVTDWLLAHGWLVTPSLP